MPTPPLTPSALHDRYLSFFTRRGHTLIPSASLIPDNDPSALFTTAGMQPLAPYLLGQPHAAGDRLVNGQRCVRTSDIDAVGDDTHLTFFEMLGNWSLGAYGREQMIPWSWEFLTGDDGLGLDPQRLYITFFAGDAAVPQDIASCTLWQQQFARAGIRARPGERLFGLGRDDNWWGPVGTTGPCGPDTEMFWDTGAAVCASDCRPGCPCPKYVEVWNDVFMEYRRMPEGNFTPLERPCIDTGMGLERMLMALNGHASIYEGHSLQPIVGSLLNSGAQGGADSPSLRIVADHARAALLIGADGVQPANTERGYVLRRLIRRATVHARRLGLDDGYWEGLLPLLSDQYGQRYPECSTRLPEALESIESEVSHFGQTLQKGLVHFERQVNDITVASGPNAEPLPGRLDGRAVFQLHATYGFPLEMTRELAAERGIGIDEEGYSQARQDHRQRSRQGVAERFAGGLAEHSEQATRYHTATHLLHAALHRVLGPHAVQRGSNITAQRLRFDFAHDTALEPQQLQRLEDLVNAAIDRDYPVLCAEMALDEARAGGAVGLFADQYGQRVKVYAVGQLPPPPLADPQSPTFSKEICGGPHVAHTGELGRFRIVKEQSAGRGLRRIRAVLEL